MSQKVRLVHRWLAPIFALATIAVIATGGPGSGSPAQPVQQLLMFILLLTGLYLFVLPFWVKSRKNSRKPGNQ
jgi:hypothetical protein